MSQTLFLKSNILHLRTNEGEFEVSNPEMIGGFYNMDENFILKELRTDNGFMFIGPDDTIDWPGEIEFIHQVMGNLESRKWERTHEYMYSKFPEDRRRKLARLLPKEEKKHEWTTDEIMSMVEKKPAQPTPNFPKGGTTFTESAVPLESENKALREEIERLKAELKNANSALDNISDMGHA